MEFRHEPVLLQEVLQWMNVRENGVYCDGTLGGGGHSEAILKASGGTARLYGIDRDENAIRAASERLKDYIFDTTFTPAGMVLLLSFSGLRILL